MRWSQPLELDALYRGPVAQEGGEGDVGGARRRVLAPRRANAQVLEVGAACQALHTETIFRLLVGPL